MIAPAGQSWAQTEHPLQSSPMEDFSSSRSIAGQPKDMQMPQPVQVSGSTLYFPRLIPERRALMTHICLAIITLTPGRSFASLSAEVREVIS
jgi:hypothetical protein